MAQVRSEDSNDRDLTAPLGGVGVSWPSHHPGGSGAAPKGRDATVTAIPQTGSTARLKLAFVTNANEQ
jgi:hypothetical protein